MPTLGIHLLGKLRICINTQVLDCLHTHKAQELFAYLLVYRDKAHSREALIELLWGNHGSTPTQSKKNLRQVLWHLQSAFGPYLHSTSCHIVRTESEWVQLNSDVDLWLDIAVFEQAFMLSQGLPDHELNSEKANLLEEAVQLYQGDFLEGQYDEWCLFERERFRNMYLVMLDKLIEYCEASHKIDTGIRYGELILKYDRAREYTHQRLMRLRYLSGDRTGALRQYRQCEAALNEELSVKPSKHTLQLYEEIWADQAGRLISLPHESNTGQPNVLDLLKDLQATLDKVQQQLHQTVNIVEGP